MAPKIRKTLHHSPDWYEKHFGENEGAPVVKAMFKHDMARVGGDWDTKQTYGENVGNYRDAWNKLFANQSVASQLIGGGGTEDNPLLLEAIAILENEKAEGFVPPSKYECGPWHTMGELMDTWSLEVDAVRQFLKWRSRKIAVKKRKPLKPRKAKLNPTQQFVQNKFFKFGTKKG